MVREIVATVSKRLFTGQIKGSDLVKLDVWRVSSSMPSYSWLPIEVSVLQLLQLVFCLLFLLLMTIKALLGEV